MPFETEKQRRWMWMNKPKMARKWTDEHGSTPVKAGLGTMLTDWLERFLEKKVLLTLILHRLEILVINY